MKILAFFIGFGLLVGFLKFAALLLTFFGAQSSKATWDDRVTELCMLEGGVKIFETISLSQEDYVRLGGFNGEIPLPREGSPIAEGAEYVIRTKYEELNESSPRVSKSENIILRVRDGLVLGTFTIFSRVGGDSGLLYSESSSFSCTDIYRDGWDIGRQIFILAKD